MLDFFQRSNKEIVRKFLWLFAAKFLFCAEFSAFTLAAQKIMTSLLAGIVEKNLSLNDLHIDSVPRCIGRYDMELGDITPHNVEVSSYLFILFLG